MRTKLLALFVGLTLLLAACAGGGEQTTPEMDQNGQGAAAGEAMPEEALPGTGMETQAPGEMMEAETPMGEGEMMETEAPMDGEMMEETLMDEGEEMMEEETPMGEGEMMETEAPMDEGMMEETPMDGEAGEMMEEAAWLSLPLTNARDGSSFSLSDFRGRVVLVETMAVWCSSCLRQQRQVLELHGLLGEREDFISVGLDVDPNEDQTQLKEFTEEQGFDWVYALAPAEMTNQLADLYGPGFLNPPSTPMLIIDRHGQVHPLPFGIKSAADLQEALQSYLDEGM